MAQKMTDAQWREFVSSGTRIGKLSTVRYDGSPHVTPVCFCWTATRWRSTPARTG